MQQYEIILKNEKEKTYRYISLLFVLVNFITVLLIAIASDFKKFIPLLIATVAILSIPLLKYLKFQKEKLLFSISFFLFALSWFCTNYWWIGIVNLVFFILDAAVSKKLSIVFNKDRIGFPFLFQRPVLWSDLSNVILKDGILTIDFKNNKIIQQQIDEASPSINEKEFNEFCSQQLAINNQKK